MRSVRDTVMAALHLIMAALHLPWLALHAVLLLAMGEVGFVKAGAPAIALSMALHGAAFACLILAAIGLLRGAHLGRTFSLLYSVLGTGGALLLWLAGARLWFVMLLVAYPLMSAYVFIRPALDSRGGPEKGT
jgi:hypothetical protein